ncbi:hypothetical protein LAUMK21_05429 [Mycobacterium pseudokansasii]|nr:hypothetical protein LAUMK21_05429 [Mycobacterium pseudokansasii]
MGGPAGGVGDGVVEVAVEGRAITAGPATRQIAAPHEIGQRLRGHIAWLGWGIAGVDQRDLLGRGGQLGDQFGADEPVSTHQGCQRFAVALTAGLFGNHVDDHRGSGRARPGSAIAAPTATAQPIGPGGQRPQRVGAALVTGARIMGTDRGRQRAQPPIQHLGIRGQQGALDLGDPADPLVDADRPIPVVLGAPAQRIGIGAGHDLVDLGTQPAPAQRRPARHRHRQLGIHRGQHLGVFDQLGAIHQRLKSPIVDLTGPKHRRDPRQLLTHRPGITQPARRQALADPQRRTHLGGHRLHGVDRPILGLGTARQPITKQLPDRGQLRGRGPILRPRGRTHLLHQRRRLDRISDHPSTRFEHTFDYATAARHRASASQRKLARCERQIRVELEPSAEKAEKAEIASPAGAGTCDGWYRTGGIRCCVGRCRWPP